MNRFDAPLFGAPSSVASSSALSLLLIDESLEIFRVSPQVSLLHYAVAFLHAVPSAAISPSVTLMS